MNSVSEQYVEIVNDLVGISGKFYQVSDLGVPLPVFVTVYHDVPEDGYLTGFSFGLSSASHAEWLHSKPELMLSVRSTDEAWVLCMGEIINNYRNECLFTYGTILHFRQRIADECPMTSFLVFASSLLNQKQQRVVLTDRIINISQLYPIYEEEAHIIHHMGVEAFFFDLDIDFCDLGRAPARMRSTTGIR